MLETVMEAVAANGVRSQGERFCASSACLRSAILSREARIGVLGLGYVGLPMAVEFSRAGMHVIGIETDQHRVASLVDGRSYITDLSEEYLRAAFQSRRFSVTQDTDALDSVDVALICVPTPLREHREPDLSAILAAARSIATHLRAGQLIVLESTTYPGTTEEVLLPLFESSGFQVGRDFFLAFSPERVDPGSDRYTVRNIPKLVGGITPTCTGLAVELYSQMVERVVPVSSPRVAEASKLFENTFRSVNIALANEMALICQHIGVDVWEVIEAAATKPFGFMAHHPGPGVGGHCIPLDPQYLAWLARAHGYTPRMIDLASEINHGMPSQVVELIVRGLREQGRDLRGSNVLLLGVAYKANVSDVRESPALEIIRLLHQGGAVVHYSDPHVPALAIGDLQLSSQELSSQRIREVDCAVVVTPHSDLDLKLVVDGAVLVVDTRNATRVYPGRENIRTLGGVQREPAGWECARLECSLETFLGTPARNGHH